MLLLNKKRLLTIMTVFVLSSVALYGCNKNGDQADENTVEDGEKVSDDNALENAVADVLDENATGDDASAPDTENANEVGFQGTVSAATAEPKAVSDRSPVEITRIEVPDDEKYSDGGSGDLSDHKHEVTPNLFPVGKCQVEINGIYKVQLSKDLIKEVNSRRAERQIDPLTENTGLDACADARCKELTYFIGHFRPDGSAFDSVGRGYIQGECIAIDYRTVNDIMEAWFSVNESRYQLMNPEYTQVGLSIYDIDNIYYIAMELGY